MEADALAHSDQPVAPDAVRRLGDGATAVVPHFEVEYVRLVVETDGCGRTAGMFEGVGQRLLDHAVGGHLERLREWTRRALDAEGDGQTSFAGVGDELRELCEVGLRRELV